MKKVILALCTVLCLTGCDRMTSRHFYIDNPTENAIHVTIDGIAYEIPSDRSDSVRLQIGSHEMVLPDGQTVKFSIFKNSRGGVINPTRSLYVVYDLIYAVGEKTSELYSNNNTKNKEVEIDGVLYEGPINTIADLIIDNSAVNYSYIIREPYPDEITLDCNQYGAYKTKLFTKKEFIDFIEEDTDSKGFHEESKVEGAVNELTQSYSCEMPVAPRVSISELQSTIENMDAVIQKYISAGDLKEQRKLYDEYKALYKKMEEEAKPLDSSQKYDTGERTAFIIFRRACQTVMETGAMEVK